MTLDERGTDLALAAGWWLIAAFAIGLVLGWAMGAAG